MTIDPDNAAISAAGANLDMSTHTTAHMSARPQRIEVIMRGERRRRWSLEQKQAIVAESVSANTSMTAIARKHGIGTGQLYVWRHQLLSNHPAAEACFARVDMVGEPRRLDAPITALSATPSGRIEIVLPDGTSVRVDPQVDERALRRVLAALRG
jgi:transposase